MLRSCRSRSITIRVHLRHSRSMVKFVMKSLVVVSLLCLVHFGHGFIAHTPVFTRPLYRSSESLCPPPAISSTWSTNSFSAPLRVHRRRSVLTCAAEVEWSKVNADKEMDEQEQTGSYVWRLCYLLFWSGHNLTEPGDHEPTATCRCVRSSSNDHVYLRLVALWDQGTMREIPLS